MGSGVTRPYCSITPPSNPSYSTPPKNCVPVTCSSGQISSPYCRFQYPYTGTLFFRATSLISDLGNSSIYTSLESSLMRFFGSDQLPVDSVYAFRQKRRTERADKVNNPFASWDPNKSSGDIPQLKGARCFSFEELKKCTNNFSEANSIGSGGYGKVYRGMLSTGKLITIKRAQRGSMQGGLEFKTEIELLSRVHHTNLVRIFRMTTYSPNPSTNFSVVCIRAQAGLLFVLHIEGDPICKFCLQRSTIRWRTGVILPGFSFAIYLFPNLMEYSRAYLVQ
ncbi:hypothetical protein U1Q18_038561 [Sarracenia purpurea var. burkii]